MTLRPQVKGAQFDRRGRDAVDDGFRDETEVESKIARLKKRFILFLGGVLAVCRDRVIGNERGAMLGQSIVECGRTFNT
jgi:hypothetical protein